MAKKQIVSELRNSVSLVGPLYPVLISKNGEIIDGRHRLEADANWPKRIIKGVDEEHILLARLVSNVCRRSVPPAEKTEILKKLGDVYLNKGIALNELTKEISERTGMSYRWVMKYTPQELKLRPGLGGPKSRRNIYESKVARCATEDQLLIEPPERVANLANYSNTNFTTLIVEKKFYLKLNHVAEDLGTSIDTVINNALLLTLQKLIKLAKQKNAPISELPI